MYYIKDRDTYDSQPLYYANVVDGELVNQQTNIMLPLANTTGGTMLFSLNDVQYLRNFNSNELFRSVDKVNFESIGEIENLPIKYGSNYVININESLFYFKDNFLCKFDGTTVQQYDASILSEYPYKYIGGYCKVLDAIILYATKKYDGDTYSTQIIYLITGISTGNISIQKSHEIYGDNYNFSTTITCKDDQILILYYEKNSYNIYCDVSSDGIKWDKILIHEMEYIPYSYESKICVKSIKNNWLLINPFYYSSIEQQFVYTSTDGVNWNKTILDIPIGDTNNNNLKILDNVNKLVINASHNGNTFYQYDGDEISLYRYRVSGDKAIYDIDGLLYFKNA